MGEYVPTMNGVRLYYGLGKYEFMPDSAEHPQELHPEFDRWLSEEVRKVKAEALREAAEELDTRDLRSLTEETLRECVRQIDWLRARAQQIEEGA